MVIVLSPSKSMQTGSKCSADPTQPAFLDQAEKLISTLRNYSEADLMTLMKISKKLAQQTRQRIESWARPFSAKNATLAVWTFSGAVFDGLDAPSLDPDEIDFAQAHLRIFSGLYGLLRPLDLMQPYRLEMADSIEVENAQNLYQFWKQPVTEALDKLSDDLLINLASQEYFKVIDKKNLNKQIVTPVFKDEKNGKFKTISLYAKRARGLMTRFIIETRATKAADLRGFNSEGYTYNPDLSKDNGPVFTRPTHK